MGLPQVGPPATGSDALIPTMPPLAKLTQTMSRGLDQMYFWTYPP